MVRGLFSAALTLLMMAALVFALVRATWMPLLLVAVAWIGGELLILRYVPLVPKVQRGSAP